MSSFKKYLLGLIFAWVVGMMFNVIRVMAEDGAGEAEDLVIGLGVAGAVLFGLSAVVGFIIFLNLKKPFNEMFRKINLKVRYFYKIHHPLTIAALVLSGLHSIFIAQSGEGESGDFGIQSGWLALGLMIALTVTGILFSFVHGKKRNFLRYPHLTLMVLVVIYIIIHGISME
ncbi:MAG TPA: hypothetical protein VMV49_16285 [Candidatus Deferrimicrobium sp.]|nr:hypothetical protein [Candidatus Deferrimicrobium sp.]